MNLTDIYKLAQLYLKEEGFYKGAIDGLWGGMSEDAALQHHKAHAEEITDEDHRRMRSLYIYRLAQTKLKKLGWYQGDLDGVWGKYSDRALESYLDEARLAPYVFSSGFPEDSYAALCNFYGPPGCEDRLTYIVPAYPMVLAWGDHSKISKFRVHEKCAQAFIKFFDQIWESYKGDYELIQKDGLHLFGGSYNKRQVRGGASWSRHSWGIAIDLDPDRNGNHTPREKAHMPEAVIDIAESLGLKNGGRAWGRDFMHFQATK